MDPARILIHLKIKAANFADVNANLSRDSIKPVYYKS
jgi:hypothetical protein